MTDVTVIGGSPRYSTVPLVSVTSDNVTVLTPRFGNGAGAFRIGKNSIILTKIVKN